MRGTTFLWPLQRKTKSIVPFDKIWTMLCQVLNATAYKTNSVLTAAYLHVHVTTSTWLNTPSNSNSPGCQGSKFRFFFPTDTAGLVDFEIYYSVWRSTIPYVSDIFQSIRKIRKQTENISVVNQSIIYLLLILLMLNFNNQD